MAYSHFETRAVSEAGGTDYVIRVEGRGTTKAMAIKNAEINAVRDVIFKDIHTTFGNHRPLMALINDPSVEIKESSFFEPFFASNGKYSEFLATTKSSAELYTNDKEITVIMSIIVKRGYLKHYLEENHLIK
ncbi:MAG: hypothetical protein K2K68_06110 [Duncaniella sp.]|nr:hypothetical protein [Duncaniella sp.]